MSSTPAEATSSSKAAVAVPEWYPPSRATPEPTLKVWNSLTKSKVEFIPQRSRQITWYNCGPTVYDASHMGHARNYVTQDVLRRIMQDYFGYDVHFVMNVTDIDDKIIIRSREEHLLNELTEKTTSLTPELLSDARTAWKMYFQKKLAKNLAVGDAAAEGEEEKVWDEVIVSKWETDAAWKAGMEAKDEKMSLHIKTLTTSRKAILAAQEALEKGTTSQESARALITGASDPLSLWLDKQHGHTLTSPSIARGLAGRQEAAFLADMAALNVLPADTLTRVSEYVPEIVRFVEKIEERGYAYSDGAGSVYFDVAAFDGRKRNEGGEMEAWEHTYAKLAPGSKGNLQLIEEGEGALADTTFTKRSASDFALWKSSKPGEPHWPSPWGEGRPGWHIECSVMATEILGEQIDIHSGGVDLKFPHHDNECAQSEAYHDCRQWINYFFHTGHLHIEGLKMSKSLKNFITIEEALAKYSARQLRLSFMLQLWNNKMDFKESAMTEVRALEASFNNFFTLVKARSAQAEAKGEISDGKHYYDEEEKQLSLDLAHARDKFRAELSDSFNTPAAVQTLAELTSKANIYLQLRRPNLAPAKAVATWIGKMLRMFGLGEGPSENLEVGWGTKPEEGQSADRETTLMPYLRALAAFRDEVRKLAIAKADPKEILAITDRLRDYELAELGVALDDQEDGSALVKLVPAATLIEARESKLAAAQQKASQAAATKAAAREKLLAKMEKAKIPAGEMFKPPHVPEGTYSAWDEQTGLPTKDGEGVELTKGKAKKAAKEQEAQKKANVEYEKWAKEEAEKEATTA